MKNHCRDCKHYSYGFTNTTQTSEVHICALRPKRSYRGDVVGEKNRQYYYRAKEFGYCSKFSPKEKEM